jgi:hypothetical protein
VDTSAGAVPARHPYRTAALVAIGVLLVIVVAGAAAYAWLDRYAPLRASGSYAPGPGLVTPTGTAAGKPAFAPAGERRTFDTAFTLRNTGRFTATVEDLVQSAHASPRPLRLLASDSATASADPGHLHAFRRLRLGPGDSAILVVRWLVGCPENEGSSDRVRLRYEYLSVFHREQTVTLPFAVTVRCATG